MPEDATLVLALELTTHEGHFIGRALNRLLVYEEGGRAYLRAAGTWDEMPIELLAAYRMVGQPAQHAFWGEGREEQSMLHPIAKQTAA